MNYTLLLVIVILGGVFIFGKSFAWIGLILGIACIAFILLMPLILRKRDKVTEKPRASTTPSETPTPVRKRIKPVETPEKVQRNQPLSQKFAMKAVTTKPRTRATPAGRPGWALLFRSPYRASDAATSWIGGQPHAPAGFDWPKDATGMPLHFMAQIDLTTLQAVRDTDCSERTVPEKGTLLVFIGHRNACETLIVEEGTKIADTPPPETLEAIDTYGFFGEPGQTTFPRWPVDPFPFLDTEEGRPDCLPDPFAEPEQWIGNWGLAEIEAGVAIKALSRELELIERFPMQEEKATEDVVDNPRKQRERHQRELRRAHLNVIQERGPSVLVALESWREIAQSKPSEKAVDDTALANLFRLRNLLADTMGNYALRPILRGKASEVREALTEKFPELRHGDCPSLPAAYRPFVEAWITDWRGHKLLGIGPDTAGSDGSLRGHDCLICIDPDELLTMVSEHEYGISIWCPSEELVMGDYGNARFARHGEV